MRRHDQRLSPQVKRCIQHDRTSGQAVKFVYEIVVKPVLLARYGLYPRGTIDMRYGRYLRALLLANLEYRWTVYNYRDWRMDAVVFWDEGQVFGEWSELQWDDFRSSVGFGVRISLADDPVHEVTAAFHMLQSLGLREGFARVVACPTCGRVEVDVVGLAKRGEEHKVESVERSGYSVGERIIRPAQVII